MLRTDLCLMYDTNVEHVECRIDNDCGTDFECSACEDITDTYDSTTDLSLDVGDSGDCCAWVF